MSIAENLNELRPKIKSGVKLVAVSKTKPTSDLIEAYEAGQRVFGENKVQEIAAKYEELKHLDIEWHFIGHLQRNKVKYIAPFVNLIHGVESIKLLKEINKQGLKNDRIISCLLQFHIAREDTKFGLSVKEAEELLESDEFAGMENIKICGVMGMATYTEDKDVIDNEFAELKRIFGLLKGKYFAAEDSFREKSMGMSNDWPVAVKNESTMIRLGSIIFGKRNYNI